MCTTLDRVAREAGTVAGGRERESHADLPGLLSRRVRCSHREERVGAATFGSLASAAGARKGGKRGAAVKRRAELEAAVQESESRSRSRSVQQEAALESSGDAEVASILAALERETREGD
jgi:hypothetical protein